ncbi:hypothetical protein GH714_020431 [Hevea brasiliensis]|uniref:P-type ATPase A domain-containing protein n=1 Tax=Hevea brasiliensis TaxID=3981 RepID=A0A6A6MJI1_HEVBR|nr:hypothetical protein GH714_020431 [Hevea brasiliensis]
MSFVLLDVPTTLSKSCKRWHLAFLAIYCSRTIYSLAKKRASKISLSPSYTVLNIKPDRNYFNLDQDSLTELVKTKNLNKLLRTFGGTDGVASAIHTNVEDGIYGGAEDIAQRQEAFVPTPLSLGFGIKEHGLKEGWYDGGSIFVAVFLVIAVSAVSNYRQNRQFDKLSKVSRNIQIDVVRRGRRQRVSIVELVVGDVVCLNVGDQVPADGLFIGGHSLQVDESSMTGESENVQVNHNENPFLFSGTKVADGYGRMLVTSVGMNTTWGNTQDENGNKEFNSSKTKADDIVNAVVGIVAAAVTIVVVAIPEGLPLAVTLTLAFR